MKWKLKAQRTDTKVEGQHFHQQLRKAEHVGRPQHPAQPTGLGASKAPLEKLLGDETRENYQQRHHSVAGWGGQKKMLKGDGGTMVWTGEGNGREDGPRRVGHNIA